MVHTDALKSILKNYKLNETYMYTPPPTMNKAAHSGFETHRRRHQKFISGPTKRTYVLQKF